MSKENKLRFNINDGKPNFRAENKQLTLIFTSHALKTAENKQIPLPFESHLKTKETSSSKGLNPEEVKRHFKMVLERKYHCKQCGRIVSTTERWAELAIDGRGVRANPEPWACECGSTETEYRRNNGKPIPHYFDPISEKEKRQVLDEIERLRDDAPSLNGWEDFDSFDNEIAMDVYIEEKFMDEDLKGEDWLSADEIREKHPERYSELYERGERNYGALLFLEDLDISPDAVHKERYHWQDWEIEKLNLSRTLLLRWNTENGEVDGKLISGEFVLKHGGDFYKYVVLFKSFLTDEDVEQLKIPRIIVPVGKRQTAKQFRASIINRIKSETSNTGLANMDELDLKKMRWAHETDDTFLVLSVSKVDKGKLRRMGIDDRFLNGLGM